MWLAFRLSLKYNTWQKPQFAVLHFEVRIPLESAAHLRGNTCNRCRILALLDWKYTTKNSLISCCVELATCFGCSVTSTKIFHQNLFLVFWWCPPYFYIKSPGISITSWWLELKFFLFLWHYPTQPVGMLTPVVVMETKWPQMNPGNYERDIFFYVRYQSSLYLMAKQL